MLRLLKDRRLQYLLIVALVLRLVAAFTYLRPTHPDELYQGIELAHLLRTGSGSDVIEILFHLRNLTLSFGFWLVHGLLAGLDTDTPYWRIVGPRCVVAFLDMTILWAVYRKLRENDEPPRWVAVTVLAVFAFASFSVRDAPSSTLEHCSAIFMWLAVGFMARPANPKQLFFAGFCAVMVAVMRYPSALFTVGFFFALFCRYCCDVKIKKGPVKAALLGGVVAFLLGGLADWAIYGRPYESFWMYLQFNVLSGLGAEKFGTSPASVYASMFWNRFGNELAVITLLALPFAAKRFWKDLRAFDAMTWGVIVYGFGHCLPAHKEVRFMIPLSGFCLWYLTMGFTDLWRTKGVVSDWLKQRPRLVFALLLLFVILPNSIRLFIVLRGDFAKVRMTYFNVLAQDWPEDVCALVSSVSFPSAAFPAAPKLVGIQELRQEDVFTKAHLTTVTWQRDPAECFNLEKAVYVIHEKLAPDLKLSRCQPQEDLSLYTKLVSFTSGKVIVWKCSLETLAYETPSVADKRISLKTNFPHLTQLPPLGIDAASLDEFVKVFAE